MLSKGLFGQFLGKLNESLCIWESLSLNSFKACCEDFQCKGQSSRIDIWGLCKDLIDFIDHRLEQGHHELPEFAIIVIFSIDLLGSGNIKERAYVGLSFLCCKEEVFIVIN